MRCGWSEKTLGLLGGLLQGEVLAADVQLPAISRPSGVAGAAERG